MSKLLHRDRDHDSRSGVPHGVGEEMKPELKRANEEGNVVPSY